MLSETVAMGPTAGRAQDGLLAREASPGSAVGIPGPGRRAQKGGSAACGLLLSIPYDNTFCQIERYGLIC